MSKTSNTEGRATQQLLHRIENYTEADENSYIACSRLVELASRAHEILESSEVDEKRALVKFLLQNYRLNG
jgi:hypothetical protein